MTCCSPQQHSTVSETNISAACIPCCIRLHRASAKQVRVSAGVIDLPGAGTDAEVWTFALKSDDGSQLYIDDQLVIDYGGAVSPTWVTVRWWKEARTCGISVTGAMAAGLYLHKQPVQSSTKHDPFLQRR